MARLPQSIDQQGPNGATASGRAVDFSSIGNALESAGAQVARWDESRREADDAVAGREIETVQQDYTLAAGLRAEEYDGRDPGFAARELAAFDAHYAPVLARTDVPDGVRDSLTRRTRELRARIGQQAIAVETTTRGRRSAADRDAADQAAALRALMVFQADFDGRADGRRQAWDGATPGFAAGTMEDFTAAQEAALADLPAPVAERLKPMLLSRQVTLQAQAMAAEDEGREAGTMATVSQGLQGLVNRAARDPSVMGRFEEEVAPILAAAPAALRERLEQETRERAQVGAIEARIQSGDYDAVEAEVERGAYDWMDPGMVARTREAVKSARANGVIEDAQAAADLEAQIAADLRAVLAGGQADASLIQRARLIGGDALAVQVETDQKAALEVRPLMARVRTMTPDQLQAELERRQAGATDAVGARALELAGSMIEADRALRSNPAAWAATPNGPGDRVAEGVRDRYRAFTAEPTTETAQAYARSTWIAQREGGVPLSQRRILDSATAESWVGSLDADGVPGDGLAALATRAALFGPEFQPQVLRELTLAGMKPADLGALTHYASSPRRMALYVQGRSLAGDDRADKATREAVDAALNTALQPYMRAIGSQRGGPATVEAARTLAYGMAARGEDVRDAVRTATAPMTDAYEYEDDWALPVASGQSAGRVRAGARNVVRDLINRDGAGLFAPASTRMTPDQSRRTYADMVRDRATWRNLADDSGLELVMTDGAGRPVRVRDAAGADVVRTWAQLSTAR